MNMKQFRATNNRRKKGDSLIMEQYISVTMIFFRVDK